MNLPSDPHEEEPEDQELADDLEALRVIESTRVILEALDKRLPEMEKRIIERHKLSIRWWKIATGVATLAALTGIGAAAWALNISHEVDDNQVLSNINICEGGNEIRRGIQEVLLLGTPSKDPDDLKPLQRQAYERFEPLKCSTDAVAERADLEQ